ncbi:MAG: GAF domain-containing protein, partial [Candidatus Sulfotelmatobacter sp.]
MAEQKSEFAVSVTQFGASLLSHQEVAPRAQLTANQCEQLLAETLVVVYVVSDQDHPSWTPKATAGDISVVPEIEFQQGTLGTLAEERSSLVFKGSDLPRESYSHFDVRRDVASLAYIPLKFGDELIGAIELVHYTEVFTEDLIERVEEIAEMASPALAAALKYESESNDRLQSITRVTQMYDLEKVFNSTLEMDE